MRFVQGGEMLFPILVVSVGYGDGTEGKMEPYINELLVIYTNMISEKIGSQSDIFPIGVPGSGWVQEKKIAEK